MGNITFSGQALKRLEKDAEAGAMEIMFPGTIKEIRLSRELMTALDQMQNHRDLPPSVRAAFGNLYQHYQWQIENDLP